MPSSVVRGLSVNRATPPNACTLMRERLSNRWVSGIRLTDPIRLSSPLVDLKLRLRSRISSFFEFASASDNLKTVNSDLSESLCRKKYSPPKTKEYLDLFSESSFKASIGAGLESSPKYILVPIPPLTAVLRGRCKEKKDCEKPCAVINRRAKNMNFFTIIGLWQKLKISKTFYLSTSEIF
jgi:hypothetical protein